MDHVTITKQIYPSRKNRELQRLYNKPDILLFIWSKQLECFVHTWMADHQLV